MMNERAPPLVTPTPSPRPPLKKGMNRINEIKKKHEKKDMSFFM
jgi:hypothetical protein